MLSCSLNMLVAVWDAEREPKAQDVVSALSTRLLPEIFGTSGSLTILSELPLLPFKKPRLRVSITGRAQLSRRACR
jgi:hypothetical protein